MRKPGFGDEAAGRSQDAARRLGVDLERHSTRELFAGVVQTQLHVVVSETRLRIFYDRDFFARAERASEARLRRDLRRCLEVEADLKSKAWLDAKLELERLVVELCAPSRPIVV